MASVESVRPILRAEMSKLKIPHQTDKVYKDECMFSFDSPFSNTGLYVNMNTYHGLGQSYLSLDMRRTGCKLYLHQKWTQTLRPVEKKDEDAPAPTKLAIGIEGGFLSESKYDILKEHSLVVVNGDQLVTFPLPCADLPEFISNVANAIIAHDGMKSNMQVSTWNADNEKIVSKYAAGLQQLNPSQRRISQDPKTWVDEATGATDNLWLNLSTGYIGGGRKNWDGTGGSGSALEHFQATGRQYPLVVKLGTITPHGADVWSYAPEEDCLVIDPQLAEHLSFWGIDVMRLEKTSKTMGELEVALNMSYDWGRILDGADRLEPLYGPGYVGLRNIGSSCYLNSAMQCLLSVPELQERYLSTHEAVVNSAAADPASDFPLQLSKLAVAVLTDRYVPTAAEQAMLQSSEAQASGSLDEAVNHSDGNLEKYVVAPRMFKALVGKGHPEFSSGRQQDVSEYFQHFLEVMSRAERVGLARVAANGSAKPSSRLFEFHFETRYQCLETGEVRYVKAGPQTLNNMFDLMIPVERGVPTDPDPDTKRQRTEETGAATTSAEPEDAKLLVPFSACLEAFTQPDDMTLFHPVLGRNVACVRTTRFRTFPRYLMVKLSRYYVGTNWVQVKINARVDVPEQLDLSHLRGAGPQEGEALMPDEAPRGTAQAAAAAPVAVVADEGLVAQLVSMGFSENGSRRAAVATHNADAEAAMNWVLEHMEDPDFNEPPSAPATVAGTGTAPGGSSQAAARQVEPEVMEMLTSMGYSERQVTASLMATDYNVERAADWLFSHMDNLDGAVAEVYGAASGGSADGSAAASSVDAASSADDGTGQYTLMAVISHIGRNTEHGHYVCHIRKNGEWALFNDEKVGKCKSPPLEHGFMYLYRRNDGPGTFDA